MIGPNPGTALTRTSPSLPAFLTTNHYSLTTAFSAPNGSMIRFRPKTGRSAALVEQTGSSAVPLAPRTPLTPPPAAPKLQRRRDSAVLQPRSNSPSPPESDDRFFSGAANPVRRGGPTPLSFCSLAPPFTSSPAHFFTRSLLPSFTSSLLHFFTRPPLPSLPCSLVPLVPWSLGPLFPAFSPHPPCLRHPPPLSFYPPPPPGPLRSPFSAPISLVPLVPWSLLLPHPPILSDPTPHAVL